MDESLSAHCMHHAGHVLHTPYKYEVRMYRKPGTQAPTGWCADLSGAGTDTGY